MIAKTKANKSFLGTTKYVIEKEQAKIIGGNMYGSTTNELVEQFTLSSHLNPQLKDPCYHLMLSVPKTDRAMSEQQLALISERHLVTVIVLSRLKGAQAQVKQPELRINHTELNQLVDNFIRESLPAYDFFIARHGDKKHDHTHIVASRVNNLDGKSIRTWNNFAHSEYSARLLEVQYNLTQVPCSWESKNKALTRNQLERVERDGLPGEEIMRRAIDAVAADKPTMPQLINRLWSEHRLRAEVSYYSHGGVRGIKYGINIGELNSDGTPRLLWKQGTNLNKYKYSFPKLQAELGISYNPSRDDQQILALTKMMQLAPSKQDLPPELSTSVPTNTELEAEQSPALPLNQWAERYAALSLGLENLLPLKRDKEIAQRAFQQGAGSDEVAQIIAASPIKWRPEPAKFIASLVWSNPEQQLEPTPNPRSYLPEFTDSQLLAAERRIELYFQAAPTNPSEQQLAIAQERYQEKLATTTTANQEYRRIEQQIQSASLVDKLLPGYRQKQQKAANLSARLSDAEQQMNRAQSQLNKLQQQRRSFENWQSSPETLEMERWQDDLSTKAVQTRLMEIKGQQVRQLAREIEQQQLEQPRQPQPQPEPERDWGPSL